jgi:hypothetical protein
MKPTATFKFPRQYKTLLSTIADPHERGVYKKALIEAILYAQQQERTSSKPRGNSNDE